MENRTNSSTVMVIDDSADNVELLTEILAEWGYRVMPFLDGSLALQAAAATPPDLVLLDIHMPRMNGYDVCRALKGEQSLQDIPVLFISALDDTDSKVNSFSQGAVDYITKPFQFKEVEARIRTHLRLHHLQKQLKEHNEHLQELVNVQVREISEAQIATILALAKLSESRDDDTGHHIERVQSYSRLLATALKDHRGEILGIDDDFLENIFQASALHDIGKVGIPDAILLKPGKLTVEEFELIKVHTTIGAETLATVNRSYPRNLFISMGMDVARNHHERWDGSGYPRGLGGADIPLSARIVALADVYDSLRSKRPYKEAMGHEESRRIIMAESALQFDPTVVEAFVRVEKDFLDLSMKLEG